MSAFPKVCRLDEEIDDIGKFHWAGERNSAIREFRTICEPRIHPVSPLRLLRERCHRERFRGLPLHLNVQARSASSFQARRFEGRVGGN